MVEWRRHLRVREEIPVRWHSKDGYHKGEGIIRNMSLSGLMMEVGEEFKPSAQTQFLLEVTDPKLPHIIPTQMKLVWYSRILMGKPRFLCGMRFTDPSGASFNGLKQHIEERLNTYSQAMDINIQSRYLSY